MVITQSVLKARLQMVPSVIYSTNNAPIAMIPIMLTTYKIPTTIPMGLVTVAVASRVDRKPGSSNI